MDSKIWTYRRMSDGAEFTLTARQAERAVYLAMRGVDPFAQDSQAGRSLESHARSDSRAQLPLAA